MRRPASLRSLLLVVGGGVIGCSGASERTEQVVVVEPPAPVPSPPATETEKPSVKPSVPIEKIALDALACAVRPPSVELATSAEKLSLCDASREHCFLEARTSSVRSGGMVLSIERAKTPRWLLEIRFEGFVLRGFIDKPAQTTSRPLVMSKFFIPRVIEVEEGLEGALRVTASVEPFVAPVAPVQADIDCSALSIARRAAFSADSIAELTKAKGKPEQLVLGKTSLFDGEGNEVARLTPPPQLLVDAFGARKGRRLIHLELKDGTVFGWVPTSALRKDPIGAGMGFGTGTGRLPDPRPIEAGQRCAQDLPIIAFFSDRCFEIGSVPAGTWFTAGAPIDAEHRELELYRPRTASDTRESALWKPSKGVRLGVPSGSLRSCETR